MEDESQEVDTADAATTNQPPQTPTNDVDLDSSHQTKDTVRQLFIVTVSYLLCNIDASINITILYGTFYVDWNHPSIGCVG